MIRRIEILAKQKAVSVASEFGAVRSDPRHRANLAPSKTPRRTTQAQPENNLTTLENPKEAYRHQNRRTT